MLTNKTIKEILESFTLEDKVKNQWPDITGSECLPSDNDDEQTIEINSTIPATLYWFKGHYPDQPVLPGVVQLNWACEWAQKLFTTEVFRGVNTLKFSNMILPETNLTLSMTYNKAKHAVKFIYSNESMIFSSGTLVFSQGSSHDY